MYVHMPKKKWYMGERSTNPKGQDRNKKRKKRQKRRSCFTFLSGSTAGGSDSSYPTENMGSGLWLTVNRETSNAEVPQLLKAKAHKASHFCGLHFNFNLYPLLYQTSYSSCLNHKKNSKNSFLSFDRCWQMAVFDYLKV